jgi:Ca-activated chloride channel family protein
MRSLSRWSLSFAFLPLVLSAPVLANGFIYVPGPHPPRVVPLPRPAPRPHFPLAVTRHRVAVEIDETLARTRVEETFHNPNDSQLEGVYLFPLPANAAVSSFRMKAGGKELAGEILEKEKAREIYEQIVRQIRDPGLLEYVDRGLFRASVFPIPPRGGVDVTIEYSESLERERGMTAYRYPLDTGKYSAGDFRDVLIDIQLRSSLPLRSIHCPSHDAAVSRQGDRQARISFEAKTLRADKDFLLFFSVSEDALAPALVTHRGHERDGFFYLSIAPRAEEAREAPPKDVLFVIDTSGSMLGVKLEQVKKALSYSVANLKGADRFNIIDFSTEARRFRSDLVTADAETKKQAERYIEDLAARGGTNIEEALRFALESTPQEGRLQMVVLLTDGEPTIGVIQIDEILKSVRERNRAGRRLFVFGVGEDLNAKLLDLLVKENRGASQYIRSQENIEVPLSNFFEKIESPVLTDLEVFFPTGGVTDIYPRPLPDLFRGEQLDLFGRYDSDGRKTVVVRGRLAGRPRVFEYSLEFGAGGRPADNGHVARLWASRKVGYLLEQMRLAGEAKELKDEVIRLSKLYGIITPYTSYLILEEERLAARPLRPGTVHFWAAPADALGAARGGAAGPAAVQVREEAQRDAAAFRKESGAEAVDASRGLSELKLARNLDRGRAFQETVNAAGVRIQNAGERTFYLQGERWIDSAVAASELADSSRLRRLQYLSEEYFELLRRHPGIGKLLAVGPLVTFLWEGELVSVVE